jgi:hypothetical protein
MAIIVVTITLNLRKTYRRKAPGAAAEATHTSPSGGSI